MTPAMKKLLIEGAELLHQDSNSIDKVMRYLDNNLATLHEELNEDNFERILEIIWDYLGNILTDLIQSNIEVSHCFRILNYIFKLLQNYRGGDHQVSLLIFVKL